MKPKRTNYEQTHQHARTHAVTRIHGHATNSKHPYALREQFYCAVLQFTPLLDRPVTLTPTPTGLCPGGGAGKLRRDDHVVDVLHHPPLEVAAAPCRRARGTRLSSSPAAASVAAQLRDRDLDSARRLRRPAPASRRRTRPGSSPSAAAATAAPRAPPPGVPGRQAPAPDGGVLRAPRAASAAAEARHAEVPRRRRAEAPVVPPRPVHLDAAPRLRHEADRHARDPAADRSSCCRCCTAAAALRCVLRNGCLYSTKS